jgi:hypothetical protein
MQIFIPSCFQKHNELCYNYIEILSFVIIGLRVQEALHIEVDGKSGHTQGFKEESGLVQRSSGF